MSDGDRDPPRTARDDRPRSPPDADGDPVRRRRDGRGSRPDPRSPGEGGARDRRRPAARAPPEGRRVEPWYARARPAMERTVGTFAAVGVGAGLMGAIGALLLTEGGTGEYGDFVVAWAFGLVGVIAVGFLGTAVAAVAGVWTARTVPGRAAYVAGSVGAFAGQVVMVGLTAAMLGPTTRVRLGGTIAVLAVVSGVPAAVSGGLGTLVGRRLGGGRR